MKRYALKAIPVCFVLLSTVTSTALHSNDVGIAISHDIVLTQADQNKNILEDDGHPYGSIIGLLRTYGKFVFNKKYSENHHAYAAQYIDYLFYPLRNTRSDKFNKKHH